MANRFVHPDAARRIFFGPLVGTIRYHPALAVHPVRAVASPVGAAAVGRGTRRRRRHRAHRAGRTQVASPNDQLPRVSGGPVSVAEQVLTLVNRGGEQPLPDPKRAVVRFTTIDLSWRDRTVLNPLMRELYQRALPQGSASRAAGSTRAGAARV